jgi:hypothetical protein
MTAMKPVPRMVPLYPREVNRRLTLAASGSPSFRYCRIGFSFLSNRLEWPARDLILPLPGVRPL